MERRQQSPQKRSPLERLVGGKEAQLFRLLVQGVRDYAIFLLDPTGHVLSWNTGAQRLKGYSADEIIGSHFSRFYGPGDRYKCALELQQAEELGSSQDEGWRVRKDGSTFWASVVITALRADDGTLVGFAKITRDLTERKQAEGKLLLEREARVRAEATDSERRLLQAVVAGIDDGITLQDRTGKLLFANASAARIIGFPTAEELLAAPASEVLRRFDLFDENGRPFPADQLPNRAVLQGGTGEEVLLRFVVRETQETRWSLVRALPVVDPQGEVAQAINVFRDVTEKHRDQQQQRFLLEAVKQFNSSLEYETTLANVAREVVPALADWCAIDMLEGDTLRRLAVSHVDPAKVAFVEELERRYPSDPDSPGNPRHILRTGQPFLLETISPELLRMGARSAEHLALIERLELSSFLAVPIPSRAGPLGVLTLAMAESGRRYSRRDVGFAMSLADRAGTSIDTARLFREKERALAREKEARAHAEQAVRFSELFLGVLGHDLRNPLSAIGTTAQLMVRRAEDDKQGRLATRIVSSTARMARMIDQLLDFTRIRIGGGLAIAPTRADLGDLAQQIVDETEAAFACAIAVERRGDLVGSWDVDRLAQALSNLLANAAQHGEGAPLLRLDGSDAASVRIEMRNPGAIPAERLPMIFEAFRGSTYRRRTSRGLGLGLYITREIVRAHGGDIEVVARDAHTSFHLELPRHARPAAGAEGPKRRRSIETARHR